MEYLSDFVQEAAGRSQGPWTPLSVPGSVVFLVIRYIVFSVYAIMDFKVTASSSSDSLASLYFFRVAFNSWVSNDVECFISDALVCPVSV